MKAAYDLHDEMNPAALLTAEPMPSRDVTPAERTSERTSDLPAPAERASTATTTGNGLGKRVPAFVGRNPSDSDGHHRDQPSVVASSIWGTATRDQTVPQRDVGSLAGALSAARTTRLASALSSPPIPPPQHAEPRTAEEEEQLVATLEAVLAGLRGDTGQSAEDVNNQATESAENPGSPKDAGASEPGEAETRVQADLPPGTGLAQVDTGRSDGASDLETGDRSSRSWIPVVAVVVAIVIVVAGVVVVLGLMDVIDVSDVTG